MLHVARTSASTTDLDAAERAYRDALVRDPNNAVYWAGVGQVQYAKGDVAGAVTTFERVVALAGDSPQMWKALAQAYRAAGRPQDAEKRRGPGAHDRQVAISQAHARGSNRSASV